jgi:pimeloyl-ACP methyl ester carboxylesterase
VETVVMIPSLGRPASDFDALAERLRAAGFLTLSVDPPHSVPGNPTLHDLAQYVIDRVDEVGVEEFHLVGHAFGNRLSRMVARDHPARILSLTLLAAGGYVEMDEAIMRSLVACFDETLVEEDHIRHVAEVFFAPGNDATVWRDGWMKDVMVLQQRALGRVNRAEWWDATAPRVLVVQALQDRVAPVGNGEKYAADHQDITTLVSIDGAGHAMLPERPDEIAKALIDFLQR